MQVVGSSILLTYEAESFFYVLVTEPIDNVAQLTVYHDWNCVMKLFTSFFFKFRDFQLLFHNGRKEKLSQAHFLISFSWNWSTVHYLDCSQTLNRTQFTILRWYNWKNWSQSFILILIDQNSQFLFSIVSNWSQSFLSYLMGPNLCFFLFF